MEPTFVSPAERQDHLFARLRRAKFVPAMDSFFLSPAYFVILGVLTAIANTFALEIQVYAVFIAIAVYICFFGKDLLPLIPLVPLCYIVPSRNNNPGINTESLFYGAGGKVIMVMATILVISLVLRLALDPEIGRRAFFGTKRKLLPGILALGCAYLLAGAGSGHYFDYGTGNIVFAAVQFLAVGLLYCVFTGGVRWDEAPKRYFCWTGLCVGLVLVWEILVVCAIVDPFNSEKIIRKELYTGWGNYNCMGAMMAMMIPFPFYMAAVSKQSWLYSLLAVVFLGGVLLSCSRTAILIAIVIYAVCFVMLMIKGRSRKPCIIVHAVLFGGAGAYLLAFHFDTVKAYLNIFTVMRSIYTRTDGYAEGIRQFLSAPIFGGSFYPQTDTLEEWSTVETFTSFFPALWHNTVIQMLAACGVVGLAAYAYHRLQTIRLFWEKRSVENIFIGLSLLSMLLMSLFDCHFFNIGPTLFYSMGLAFAEKHRSDAE